MELKWFRPTTYTQGLGHVLGMIYKELVALQPVDSTDVTWRRTSTGIQAYVKQKPVSSTGIASSLPQTETPKAAAAALGEKYQFTITTEIREVENEDGTKSNVPFVVVVDANDPKSGVAGVVRLGDGTLLNVASVTLPYTNTLKYVHLVCDASKNNNTQASSVYIMSSSQRHLTTVLGGSILIGSYTKANASAALSTTQNLNQNTPVEIGPTYVGPWCILPGMPTETTTFNYIVNPAGSLELGSGHLYVNGVQDANLVPPKTLSSTSRVQAYVAWTAPRYDGTSTTPTRPSSVSISASSPGSYADASMAITGNTAGMIDLKWMSAISAEPYAILFDNSMIES